MNEADSIYPQQLVDILLENTRLQVKQFIESYPAAFGLENLMAQTKILSPINKRIAQLYQDICEIHMHQGVPFDHAWVNNAINSI